MPTTVRLTVLDGPHKGGRFCFRRPEVTVGRGADCDVRICGAPEDASISRRHCKMWLQESALFVQDLESTNGTCLNDKCLDVLPGDVAQGWTRIANVQDGDILSLGDTRLEVELMDCPRDRHPVEGALPWPEQAQVLQDCPASC